MRAVEAVVVLPVPGEDEGGMARRAAPTSQALRSLLLGVKVEQVKPNRSSLVEVVGEEGQEVAVAVAVLLLLLLVEAASQLLLQLDKDIENPGSLRRIRKA